jgi:uncharacterized membrane protein YsdA (DUF1294 family)
MIPVILGLNLFTFALYGLDKFFAIFKLYRVPEKMLWFFAFCGGPFGALLGMYVFRHKVSKTSFQFVLAILILAEVGLFYLLQAKFHLFTL